MIKYLLEKAIMVIESHTVSVQSERCDRIKETSCQTSQSTITE